MPIHSSHSSSQQLTAAVKPRCPQEVDWTRPTAVVLGNEKYGVTQEAVELADACAILPMAGYVESFNISVAAALIFYEAQQQRIRKLGASGDLSEHERKVLKAVHVVRSLVGGWAGWHGACWRAPVCASVIWLQA